MKKLALWSGTILTLMLTAACGESGGAAMPGRAEPPPDPAGGGRPIPEDAVPAYPGRAANFFGIHAMIYPGDNIEMHLDWAHHLVGDGGYVKVIANPIDRHTAGPDERTVAALNGIYDRGMIPIVRLTTNWVDGIWSLPDADGPGDYTPWAAAAKRLVEGLPLHRGVPLYVEILNEVNLSAEWGGTPPDPAAYGHLLVDAAKAIRSIQDPRIRIVSGGLSPNGEYDNVEFLANMFTEVPESLYAFDVLGSHPYPGDHPPEYNIHDGTAKDPRNTIDAYLNELAVVEKFGRTGVKVILTETGYALGNNAYQREGMPAVTEELRADYTTRAFRDYWSKWPEIIAVTPFELSATAAKNWTEFDWVSPYSRSGEDGYPTHPKPVYEAIAALPKLPYVPEAELAHTESRNRYPFAEEDPLNLALQASVRVSSSLEENGWSRRKLNDNRTAPQDLGWSSGGGKREEWVQLAFEEPRTVSRLVLAPRTDAVKPGAYFPQAFTLAYSNDGGRTWVEAFAKRYEEPHYNPGTQEQEFTFQPFTASLIRLIVTELTNMGDGDYYVQLAEIKIYEK